MGETYGLWEKLIEEMSSEYQAGRASLSVMLRACSSEGPQAESCGTREGAHREGGHRRQGEGTAQRLPAGAGSVWRTVYWRAWSTGQGTGGSPDCVKPHHSALCTGSPALPL